jgi:hypothetical protein
MLGLPYLQSSSLLHQYLIFILPGQGFGLFKLRNYRGNFFHLGVDKTNFIKKILASCGLLPVFWAISSVFKI